MTDPTPPRFLLRHEEREIYRVMLDERAVGTIEHHRHGPAPYWSWSVTGIVPNGVVGVQYGTAPTREQAMVLWRACWDEIEAKPHGVLGRSPS